MADLKDEFKNVKDHTPEMDPQDIQDNKVMGILAYCAFLVFVPIFAAKGSKFARFHANYGLILFIAEAASNLVLGILSNIRFIGWIFGIAEWAVTAVCIFFAVLGIINASKGQAKELPIIGGIKILK